MILFFKEKKRLEQKNAELTRTNNSLLAVINALEKCVEEQSFQIADLMNADAEHLKFSSEIVNLICVDG